MTIVSVQEQFQPFKYLIVSNQSDPNSITTTRVIVSDIRSNAISLINIEKGPQGDRGLVGPSGPPGKDGLIFDVLPVESGGTNNTIFSSGYLITYDGSKLLSTPYTPQDLLTQSSAPITGIIAGTGLQKQDGSNNTVFLDIKIGDGLTVENNQIIVDDSIARITDLSLGSLNGIVPISKGGTNNSSYSSNRLIYYDGFKFSSFPLNTGNIVVSGSSINIVAGSGLVGGGLTSIPNGTVVISIPNSADILVEENSISLTNTGIAGTYTKIITDEKGRVVSGTSLTNSDILSVLGYTPWHPGNDGDGSGLDADLLDGLHGSYYRNSANLTGVLNTSILPDIHPEPIIGTKFRINTKGLIEESYFANSTDIISSLGYTPLDANSDAIKQGSLDIIGDLTTSAGDVSLYDNLPLFGTNRPDILPSEPRGFTFNYGGIVSNKTGILAYYPTENQLKLITNIFGSGSNVDGNSGNQDDINGGNAESIFIINNLEGDPLTVLFREIADQLYIDVNNIQTIYGLKRFLGQIEVAKQIRILSDGNPFTEPPILLYGNNVKVPDLNADLLDDRDGSYYRNAANITGSFSYQNVAFDHIAGENNYIPKFNDSSTPSRRINSSNILQRDDGDIEISNGQNLIIGESDNEVNVASINTLTVGENNLVESENAATIGLSNTVLGLNSLAVGQDNIASGNNSLALNIGSITNSNKSIAAGSYGLTQLENQFAFGAFRTLDSDNDIVEHGQYSTIAAYLRGIETNGSWVSMSPVISLPQDKTIAYNIELLINKGLSSGVAHYTFTSGIINNATYRDPLNITEIRNSTTVPNTGTKTEIFNNSQIRRHYHYWNYIPNISEPDIKNRLVQYINVLDEPAIDLPLNIRNVHPYYFYRPESVKITGVFEKSFDGSLVVDIRKPRYNATFNQSINDPNIFIYSKNHGSIPNAEIDINFLSGSKYFLPSRRYKTLSIINNNNFIVESPKWIATKFTNNNQAIIKFNNTKNIDNIFTFHVSGTISNNIIYNISNATNNYGYNIFDIIQPDMNIKIIYDNIAYNRVVRSRSIHNSQIEINHPIYAASDIPNLINANIQIILDEYSYFIFKTCDKVFVNTESINFGGSKNSQTAKFLPDSKLVFANDGGQGTFQNPSPATLISQQNSGIFPDNDVYNNPSFSIILAASLNNIPDGSLVSVQPLFNSNSGTLDLYHRDSFDCSYTSSYSELNKHRGCYIRWQDKNTNKHKITIFDSGNLPINFISNPPKYYFADGYLSDYNNLFYIKQEYSRYYLYTKTSFNHEEMPIVPIKLKAVPYVSGITQDFEKVLYVYVDNVQESPYVLNPISNTGILIDNLYTYTIPIDTFDDSDNDSLELTAKIKGGYDLPSWLSFDTNTKTFSGIPSVCDVGFYSIDIIATDPSGFKISDNFIIEVLDNPSEALEGYAYDVNEILKTQNIYLTNNRIPENSPPDTLVGEIKHVGGYNPYLTFLSAENSFSGTFVDNSDLIRYCKPNIRSFIPATISGSPEYLNIDSIINLKSSTNGSVLSSNMKVKNVYKPTIFSGTPLINSNQIILDDIYRDYYSSVLFENQKLPTVGINESFGSNLRVKTFNDYSIVLSNYLIQELDSFESTLILTEDNETLTHNTPNPYITYYIEDELTTDDISEENGSNILYADFHNFNNVVWSNKNEYSYFFTESLQDRLSTSDDALITNNNSNIETIYYPPSYIDVAITDENNNNLITNEYQNIKGQTINDIWFSNSQASKIYRTFHSGIEQTASSVYTTNPLSSLSFSSGNNKLLQSNIDYHRDAQQLYNPNDYWYFNEPINNSVLYLHNIGSEDNAHLIGENRAYSGNFYPSLPLEYALLCTEDGHGIISDTKTHHGSRIELSHRYEILESINVYNDNGKLFTEFLWDEILCENNDRIVNDYAIAAQTGFAYILLPGIINNLRLNYPKNRSYSKQRVGNIANGYYEDILEYTPESLAFTEPNFYYSWGKLISYQLYTNEYVVRTDKKFNGTSNQIGIVSYQGNIPVSGQYFPEFLQNFDFMKESGNCPEPYYSGGINGFGVIENFNISGAYVTGLIEFYTNFTSNNIETTSLDGDINQDPRNTDAVYLHSPMSNSVGVQLPRTGLYEQIKNIRTNGFTVENFFLYPSTAIVNHTGLVSVNLDRNHQQTIKNPKIVNTIPIKFNEIYSSNQNRLPKNNIFDILNISGNKIYLNDFSNYTLKENNKPDYFNHTILSSYLTNGCRFLGSLFNNDKNIYDVRPSINILNQEYKKVSFEYDKDKQELSIDVPTGIINLFDNIQLYDFLSLSSPVVWNPNNIHHTGFMVLENNISIKNLDSTPDQDSLLLETSKSFLQSEHIEKLTFHTNIFANSIFGTCTLNTKLANRLRQGYLINYESNQHNQSGHQVQSIHDGYIFSGVVPRNHNIFSSNQLINDYRIGKASIVGTGNSQWLNGIKTIGFVSMDDIGYTEYYKINSTGLNYFDMLASSSIFGNGSTHLPYKIFLDTKAPSPNIRFIEFLYLGHNTNNIVFSGIISTSSSNEITIHHIKLADQLEIERLASLGYVSGIDPICVTGTEQTTDSFYYSITGVNRYDLIQIRLKPSHNQFDNYASLYSYATNAATPSPVKLESSSFVNTTTSFYPQYKDITTNTFGILPCINTTVKYCSNNSYIKNHNLFYNGNIIRLNNFDSIKSFLNYDDQLKLLSNTINGFNVKKINSSSQTTYITGISLNGDLVIPPTTYQYSNPGLLENVYTNVSTFSTGLNKPFPISGSIEFVGYNSGACEAIIYNNIYVQSYGGSSSRWPQDPTGKLISHPITGIYSVSFENINACESGRLCVSISGYRQTRLEDLLFDHKYYFDFSDDLPVLNNSYVIKDKLSPYTISINIPYNTSYINKSGIVYIIDSNYNIKSNLFPNANNSFITSSPTISNTNLVKNQINSFDNNTKKWNHVIHLQDNISQYSSYPITITNGTPEQARIIYYPEKPISITNVSVLTNELTNTFSPLNSNSLSVFNDSLSVVLRIQTSGGSPVLQNKNTNIPKVFISGIGEYRTILDSNLYDYRANSGWDVGIEMIPFKGTGVFPVQIMVRDETGYDTYDFELSIKKRPSITPTYPTGYASLTSLQWKLYFDVDGIDLLTNNPNNQGLYVSGSPNDLNYEFVRHSSSELEVIGYPAGGGFGTGVWTPVIKIADISTGQIAASGSGLLKILDSLNDRPNYAQYLNKYSSDIDINLASFDKISYFIPVFETDQDHTSIISSLNGGIYFGTIRTAASYDADMNRYRIEYTPTNTGDSSYINSTSYASSRPFNYTVSQPTYIDGNRVWNNYTSINYLNNITFYRPIAIDTSFINTVPEFSLNEPWSVQFAVKEGVTKHRPDLRPRVTLYNTPGFGTTSYQYLSYNLFYKYDNVEKYWIITAVGRPDPYGRYAANTGIYTIDIFVDDSRTSFAKDSFNIKYIPNNTIKSIAPNVYTTPNNEFFINAEVDQPYSDTYPLISFDGENTIAMNYNNMYRRYNHNLNIWEIAGTGNKMINKWDARLVINTSSSPSLTLQCKGIATDKITAVAKVNLLELQNTNKDIVDGLPIKITGITGGANSPLTPESGIIVEQGNNPWKLSFNTIRGLASPLHPPTIILENTPTFCTGYDPRLDPNYSSEPVPPGLQNSCLINLGFNNFDKSWSFAFSGYPSCTLLGAQDFSITAIDTDLSLPNPYLEPSDRVDTKFTYIPISTPHPGPFIAELSAEDEPLTNTILKPLCNTMYYLKLSFGPRSRDACPIPTGLTGIIFSGSLPTGLSYSLEYPASVEGNAFNSPTYDNLSNGYLTIYGYPSGFAQNGNKYNEEFGITVVDARNQSTTKVISFSQSVNINDPNIGMRVYFESDKPVFTPFNGLAPITIGNLFVYQPDPEPYELVCRSILPNNNCPARTVLFSGLPLPDNNLVLLPIDENQQGLFNSFSADKEIYIEINNDSNNINNGRYFLKRSTSTIPNPSIPANLWYIDTKEDFSPRTGIATIVAGNYKAISINQGFANLFNGDIQSNSICVLGNGLIDISRVPQSTDTRLGIRGHVSPTFSGIVPVGGTFNAADTRLLGLNFTKINNSSSYTEIPYVSCWETGYLRISGIILPKIYIEITDPPPAFNDNFSVNGSTFALNSRLSFGDTELERSNPTNWRNGSANYSLVNLLTNQTILNNSVSISINNQQSIPINASTLASSAGSNGTVFKLDINAPGDLFPTYTVNSKPTAQPSTYFWIHKAKTTLYDVPDQSSFPPVIPVMPNTIKIVSGELINFNNNELAYGIDAKAYGGYIPHNICFNGQCPPGYSNDPYFISNGTQWSAKNYLPIISGIILQDKYSSTEISISGSYTPWNSRLSFINNTILTTGNIINVVVKKPENNTLIAVDAFTTGLLSSNFENNEIVFSKNYGWFSSAMDISITFTNQIINIDTINHKMLVKHNNISLASADIVAINSTSTSTSKKSIDNNGLINIESINNTGLFIAFGGTAPAELYSGFNIGDYINIYKTIEDNIKIMSYNITSANEGVYDFIISGRANILYGPYIYRIITKENSNMPIFTTSITPKTYEKDIPMYVSKPISVADYSLVWVSNSWTLQIEVEHGSLPYLSETIDVQIDLDGLGNYGYCGFDRYPVGVTVDSFNSTTNKTIISLSSNNRINWSTQTSFTIKLSDSTGEDYINISKP